MKKGANNCCSAVRENDLTHKAPPRVTVHVNPKKAARRAKLAELKQRLADGDYQPNAQEVAEALIKELDWL